MELGTRRCREQSSCINCGINGAVTSGFAPEREKLESQFETLQRDIRQLQIEHDLLKKANELIKKDLGADLQSLSNREKTMLTRALKNLYKISDLLARLRLARSSSFYHRAHIYHRARIALQDKYLPVRRAMTDIFARKPSLLRRPSAQSLSDTAIYLNLGKRVCSG